MPKPVLWATIRLDNPSLISQGLAFGSDGAAYLSQDDGGKRMLVTRCELHGTAEFVPGEQMAVADGGHGMPLIVEGDGIIHLDHDSVLRRTPFRAGPQKLGPVLGRGLPVQSLTGIALMRKVEGGNEVFYAPPKEVRGKLPAKSAIAQANERQFSRVKQDWIQGIVYHGGLIYTLRGTPYVASGPLYAGEAIPAYVSRRNATVSPRGLKLPRIKVDQLGRGPDGKPINGKIEPEGLAVTILNEIPHLVIGISTGHKGNYRTQLWTYQLPGAR